MNPFPFIELLERLENQVLPALSHRLSQRAEHVFKVHESGAISIKNGKQLGYFFLCQFTSKLSESLPEFLKKVITTAKFATSVYIFVKLFVAVVIHYLEHAAQAPYSQNAARYAS